MISYTAVVLNVIGSDVARGVIAGGSTGLLYGLYTDHCLIPICWNGGLAVYSLRTTQTVALEDRAHLMLSCIYGAPHLKVLSSGLCSLSYPILPHTSHTGLVAELYHDPPEHFSTCSDSRPFAEAMPIKYGWAWEGTV